MPNCSTWTEINGPIEQVKELGAKSKAIIKAVELLANGIRRGNKYANKIVGRLDGVALQVFRQHSLIIASRLEKLAQVEDLIIDVIKTSIIALLNKELGVDYVIAQDIGQVIAIVIDSLL